MQSLKIALKFGMFKKIIFFTFILLALASVFGLLPVHAQVTKCEIDITQDGIIDLSDFAQIAANFGRAPLSPRTDITKDGIVDLSDFALIAANFSQPATNCSPTPPPIVNKLTNGGFETGTSSSWTGTFSITQTEKYEGKYAAQVTSSNGGGRQSWINVTPGKQYVASAWFKWSTMSDNDWGYSRFTVADDSWKTIAEITSLEQKYSQNQWHQIALTFTPQASRISIDFGIYGPETAVNLYFDDIKLFEKNGNFPPVVNPTTSVSSGGAPLTVSFASNGLDYDGAITTYQWQFGDGAESREKDPTHIYTIPGNYVVLLNAYDNDGAKETKQLNVTVTGENPISISLPDSLTSASDTITITGQAQSISGNVNYLAWDNISTSTAKSISISPSQNTSFSTSVPLKPGENEILLTAKNTSGKIAAKKIIVNRTFAKPVISNISTSGSTPKVYEKYEVSFDVATVAKDYMFMYDANPPRGAEKYSGVTVEGVITLPNGQTETHPAFYFTSVNKSGSKYIETASSMWKLRYSPRTTGLHSVALRITDKNGTATTQVGSFNAQAPSRPGFIQVSKDDTRYFEHSDGTLHWPLGMTWSGSSSPTPDGIDLSSSPINYDRPWLGGRGIYTTNWARWKSSAEQHGNEGVSSRFSYLEHYPSSELSQHIFYPDGYRMWISCWLDETTCATISQGKTYQVTLRLKTKGITGPKQSGLPYGLVVKTNGFIPNDFDNTMRSRPNWISHINGDTPWHTVVATVTASDSNSDFYIYLDNVTAGEAFIDMMSVREVLAGGTLGGEQVRNPKADMHTYVEQRPLAYTDNEVSQGEINGTNLRYVVHDKNDWIQNHLNSAGVFVSSGDGYYQPENSKATWLLKQWWRYLVARYGYSTSIFGWELNNEGPPDDGSGTHARNTQIFAKWMHDMDAHPHLANTSFWSDWMPTFWGDKVKFPDVDFADIHHYGSPTDMVKWYLDEAVPAYNDKVGKPIVRGELGIMEGTNTNNFNSSLAKANPGVWYHNMLWSQLHPSSMYELGYWYSEHGKAITGTRAPHALAFYNFVKDLDLNKGGYVDIAASSTQTKFRILGQKNLGKNKAHGWVNHIDNTWSKVMASGTPIAVDGTINLQMNPNRNYTVTLYDTYSGQFTISQSVTSTSSGALSFSVANINRDVAFIIR